MANFPNELPTQKKWHPVMLAHHSALSKAFIVTSSKSIITSLGYALGRTDESIRRKRLKVVSILLDRKAYTDGGAHPEP